MSILNQYVGPRVERDRAIAQAVDSVEREAARILENFARDRALRPLGRRVPAWEPPRTHVVSRITAAELRASWQQIKESLRGDNERITEAAIRAFERDLVAFLEP